MERDGSLLDDYVLSLTDAQAPASAFCRPPPATPTTTWCRFYRRFSLTARPAVSLFAATEGTGGVEDDLASHLLAQD